MTIQTTTSDKKFLMSLMNSSLEKSKKFATPLELRKNGKQK